MFIPLHHVILPNAILCSYQLNTLDACWIAVDVWSNSSRWRIVLVYLSQTWCLYTWSCLDILITMRFSINCSTVICSPTVKYAILREATSETYGPQVYFTSYYFPINLLFLPPFILQSLLSNLYNKNTKNIYLIIFIRSHFCKWPWSDCVGGMDPGQATGPGSSSKTTRLALPLNTGTRLAGSLD